MSEISDSITSPPPPYLRLRAFAFDPIISRRLDTSEINEVTIQVPWYKGLEAGPVDNYLEVVDYDPASRAFYAPVDLNDPRLLAQDGLPPSEGVPQFHQQMAYAVARTTIGHFEAALGRRPLWSVRLNKENKTYREEFTDRLRIYPHGLREANAYYSPSKKALLFGYFPASFTEHGQNMPGETVFTCLSHDIVAHETTHALVDGLHPRFIEPSNIDVLALHEAIADIVALFQHFTYPQVLKHQIAATRGELEKQSLLGELAYQFGQAIGNYGALRSAIGKYDPATKKWITPEPDPSEIRNTIEPHLRGAILVAVIFDAFLTIYKSRIRDLLRIASGGSGILPPGDIHPDLVDRLAQEAAKSARHILQMCIRALDYCPPVDIDFGDYLRAMITADAELVTDDRHNYRLAVIEAFRKRGIYPCDIHNLSVESLKWHVPDDAEQKAFKSIFHGKADLRKLVPEWDRESDPRKIHNQINEKCAMLHEWFVASADTETAQAAHLLLNKRKDSVYRGEDEFPSLEIHSIRPAHRVGPDGQTVTELVIEMTQRRRGYYDIKKQNEVDNGEIDPLPEPDFIFRGGCTLLVDPVKGKVRYCIHKDVMSENRLQRMRDFLSKGTGPSLQALLFGDPYQEYFPHLIRSDAEGKEEFEPFALLHRSPVPWREE